MPRKPRNRGIQRKDKGIPLTNPQLEHLIFGHTWLDQEFPFESEKDRREFWERHKRDIFAMMSADPETPGFVPWLRVGMRPAAFFEYENHPPLKDGQTVPEYLDEHQLWFTNEKQRYLKMTSAIEKRLKGLREVVDLTEFRRD